MLNPRRPRRPRRRLIVIFVVLLSRDALEDGGGAREGVVDEGGVEATTQRLVAVRDPGQSLGWCVTQLATTPDVLSSNSARRKSASAPSGDGRESWGIGAPRVAAAAAARNRSPPPPTRPTETREFPRFDYPIPR